MRSGQPRRRLAYRALLVLLLGAILLFSETQAARAEGSAGSVQWSPLSPRLQSSSGKVNAFAYVQSNPATMYTGGGWGNTPRESPSQAGIYRTTDRGKHWMASDNGLTSLDGTISSVVNGLWLDQAKPSVVLAATEFGGTFRSTDGGNTWHSVDRSESTQFSQSGATLYLATRRGVLASMDDGASWSVSLASATGATTVVTAAGKTYAGTTSGDVYLRSGSSWSKMGHPGSGPIHDLAIDPFNTKVVYANVDDISAWNENLYGSLDSGKTWKRIHCPCSIGAQAIAFSLVVPHRLYLADDGGGYLFYLTADGNPHPTLTPGAQTFGADVRYIFPVLSGSRGEACYFSSDQGLFLDAQCGSGTPIGLSNKVPDFLAYSVTVAPKALGIVIALQDWGAVSSADGGKNVQFVNNSGEGAETFINPFNPKSCYMAHPDNGLYISADGCATFSGPSGSGIESLAFVPGTTGTLYAVTNADFSLPQMVLSTNGGSTFNATLWQFKHQYQVVVSPSDAKTILVASGTPKGRNFLSFTHDGGKTWHQSSGLPTLTPRLQVGLYYPTHRFYAAFEPGAPKAILLADHDPTTDNILVYRSIDKARTFSLASTLVQPVPPRPWPNMLLPTIDERPAPEIPYYATRFYGNRLGFNPQAPKSKTPAVVLTTRFGAFASFDAGSHWSRIDTTAISHHFIGVAWVSGYVYLSTFGEGAIKSATPLQ